MSCIRFCHLLSDYNLTIFHLRPRLITKFWLRFHSCMIHRFSVCMKITDLNSLIVLFLPWSSSLKFAVTQVGNDGFSNHTQRAADEIFGCVLPCLTYILLLSPALSFGVTRTEPETDHHVYYPPYVWMVWCADTNHAGVLLFFRRCRMAGYVTTASTNGSYIREPADTELTWHSICLVVLLCILIAVTVVSRPVLGVWTAWYKWRQAREKAEHSGRTVWAVCLRQLTFWDCGFESHRGHMMFVCCESCVLCCGSIPRRGECNNDLLPLWFQKEYSWIIWDSWIRFCNGSSEVCLFFKLKE